MEPFDLGALGCLLPDLGPQYVAERRVHPHGPGWEQLPLFEDDDV